MNERILYWENDGLNSAVSLQVLINETITYYSMQVYQPEKAYLQPYYMATFHIDDKSFPVPGTEELKVFSMTECKVICGTHWAKYYDNAYFPKTIIQAPPPEILSPNS